MPASAKRAAPPAPKTSAFIWIFCDAALETEECFAVYRISRLARSGARQPRCAVPDRSLRCVDDLAAFLRAAARRRWACRSSPLWSPGRASLTGGLAAPGFDTPCPVRWDEVAAVFGRRAARQRGARRSRAWMHALARRELCFLSWRCMSFNRRCTMSAGFGNKMAHRSRRSISRPRCRNPGWRTAWRSAKAGAGNGRRTLFGCLAENRHVLGIRMVADAFELDGWTTYDLEAPATPTADTHRRTDSRNSSASRRVLRVAAAASASACAQVIRVHTGYPRRRMSQDRHWRFGDQSISAAWPVGWALKYWALTRFRPSPPPRRSSAYCIVDPYPDLG